MSVKYQLIIITNTLLVKIGFHENQFELFLRFTDAKHQFE